MSIKKKGLGKGLDSLIPDNKSIKSVTPDKSAEAKKEAEEKAGVQTMKINEVEPKADAVTTTGYWACTSFILPTSYASKRA